MDNASRDGTSDGHSTPASDLRNPNQLVQRSDWPGEASEDSDASDGGAAGYTSNGTKNRKPRSTHACQACRRMKIRCEPLEGRDSCKQCAKVNRECLVTEPRRKRQKTVHRVSELEKKIDALTASLNARDSGDAKTDWNVPPGASKAQDEAAEMARSLLDDYSTARGSENSGQRRIASTQKPYIDVIDRAIVDQDSAYRAFQRYHLEMCHFTPVVVFPASTTAEEIRVKRPYLFLSILTAAIGRYLPEKQADLCDELTYLLADKILYRGERSLELVQALLVLMLHYSRPKHHSELNFNQIIHVAATMALDLGMGRRSKKGVFKEKTLFPGVSVAETRRTWIGCYYMCANAAMSLRHPIFIRWSPYIEESLEYLLTSPDALPSDAWLVDQVKIQHISEEVAFIFSMDDPAFVVSLADPKTQYHIRTFEREVSQWRKQASTDVNKPWVRHIQEAINLYIHEIAIHFDHNVDDFRPPPHMTDETPADQNNFITPAHVDALVTCQESIHKLFNAFFEMDTETIRNLPNLYFVRTAYAAVALIKMEEVLRSRGPKVEEIFDLKVEVYLQTTLDVLAKAAEGGKALTAFGFGFVFRRLKNWYKNKWDDDFGPDGRGAGAQELQACCPPQQLGEVIDAARKDFAESIANGEIGAAAYGPTTVNEDEMFVTPNVGLPYPLSYATNNNYNNDTSMYSLGLPQFYDFGFTFDDAGLMGELASQDQGAPGWYPTTVTPFVGGSPFRNTK